MKFTQNMIKLYTIVSRNHNRGVSNIVQPKNSRAKSLIDSLDLGPCNSEATVGQQLEQFYSNTRDMMQKALEKRILFYRDKT